MISIDTALLRETLELALVHDDRFPDRFYTLLFAAHPELRPLFHRNSAGAQSKMFAQKLTALVDNLEDPGYQGRELAEIARSHAEYGARPEMYPIVGEALIAALREACGDAWSPEAERAWAAAYDALSRAILAVPAPDAR